MLEFLQANTALPNLHPVIVHFPVVFIVVAWIMRVGQVIVPHNSRFRFSADIFTVAAAFAGCVTWLSGREAVNSLGGLTATAELALARHADVAGWAVIALIVAAAIPRIWILSLDSELSRKSAVIFAWLNLGLSTIALGIIGITADLGGALVYQHGVGVQTQEAKQSMPYPAWTNDQGSTAFVAFPGNEPIWEFTPGQELSLEVSEKGLVALPGIWGDSIVEVTIDSHDFEGSLTLVHRYTGPDDWEGFVFTTDNTMLLLRNTGSKLEVRDKSSLFFSRDTFTMRSSAVSGHYKGIVSGDVMVHGHGESGEKGRVGLLIEGVGKLKLSDLQVSL